jgi:hypothetical protein
MGLSGARPPVSLGASSSSWPGLRVFRSARFRATLAVTLLAGALYVLGGVLARQVADPAGQFAIDFTDYWVAAGRLSAEGIPYDSEMLAGPIDAQGTDRYRYPPVLAQLLLTVRDLGLHAAAWLWLTLQAVAIWCALWVSSGVGGARRSAERALWCGVAAAYFLPCFDTLWKGNVSGIQALQLALVAGGGAVGGMALATAVMLKVTPLALVPAAIGASSRVRLGLLVGGGLPLVVSVLAAPEAWLAYAQVLPNMLAGDAEFATNLAPASIAASAGLQPPAVDLIRLASLVIGGIAIAAAALLVRRPEGWPAAVTLGIAGILLIPAALWYHYLVVLLVPAAIAWPRATLTVRLTLAAAAGLISLSLLALPLALVGAALMLATSLWMLWPRTGSGSRAQA